MKATKRLDLRDLGERARDAIGRARAKVCAVPLADRPGLYTLSTTADPEASAGLEHRDAERYAATINAEAELASAMLVLLAEIERLSRRD